MVWKYNKKPLDLEKAIGEDTTSSFGSVKSNVILLPPKAHSNGSPMETKFEQSGNSSPQFTSSFPTSEQRERKMRTFVMRHAFIVLVLVMFIIGGGIATFMVLFRKNMQMSTLSGDQTAQTIPVASAFTFPTFTAVITSASA